MGVRIKKEKDKIEIMEDEERAKYIKLAWILINIGCIFEIIYALFIGSDLFLKKINLLFIGLVYIFITPIYLYARKKVKQPRYFVVFTSKNIEIYENKSLFEKSSKKVISLSNIEFMVAKEEGKEDDIYYNTIILKQKEAPSEKEMYVKFSIPEMSVNEFLKIFNEFTNGGKKYE